MKQSKKQRTYIRGPIPAERRDAVRAHMDLLGMDFITTPGEFESNNAFDAQIMAYPDVLGPSSQLPMHSHTWMEIFHYVSDSRVEYLIGSHRYMVQKGDIVCVPPGTCHQVLRYEPQGVPCVRNLICILPSFLEYFGWSTPPDQYYILRSADLKENSLDLGAYCDLCAREYLSRGPRWRDMVSGSAQILLTQILRNSDLSVKAEPDGMFEQILSYVNDGLSQTLTLSGTARHFFTSERTVTREFQKNLGTSFYRYVTQRRLLTARNLIFNNVPMKDVCHRVGFKDYPTFYRAFKKEYGISPKALKEMDKLIDRR